MTQEEPSRANVVQAANVLQGHVHRTPVVTSKSLSALTTGNLLFKCENLQKVGAFKIRGATHAIAKLTAEQLALGVCTHSSGNHAQALACAAKETGIKCWVVMPENSAKPKIAATKGYGANIIFSAPSAAEREKTLRRVQAETGATFIPPYDHVDIIAGQGTLMLEFLQQAKEMDMPLDAVLVPVGGGGMLSGCALACDQTQTTVYGAEPLEADDAARGFHSGSRVTEVQVTTIADGLRTPVGVQNFEIIKKHVADIFTVTEEQIVEAMRLVMERMKLVVEPSGAVPLAVALFNEDFKRLQLAGNIGIVFSGGNVDFGRGMPWLAG